ncbi:MAG: queG 5 [Firmicutes bacterium]|nr:queG 5 [Bacillota bacterium]
MNITANQIKDKAKLFGADLCGVAPVERFLDAPIGFQPTDVLKTCKSVVVFASRFPVSTLTSTQASYTFVRNKMIEKLDSIAFNFSMELESYGICAVPVPSSEPYEYWDDERKHGQGILSLKHSAVRAGLGKLGKNTLLVNDKLGNMLWLGAVLVDIELEADKLADYEACLASCRVCLDSCPTQALDGTTISQKKCRSTMAKCTDGGGWVISCNICRKICPNHKGIYKSVTCD